MLKADKNPDYISVANKDGMFRAVYMRYVNDHMEYGILHLHQNQYAHKIDAIRSAMDWAATEHMEYRG